MPRVDGNQSLNYTPIPDESEHTVEKGDSLSKIADQLIAEGWEGNRGELVQELADLNGLKDVDRIEVGQELRLPDPAWLESGGSCQLPQSSSHGETFLPHEFPAKQAARAKKAPPEADPKVERHGNSPCWNQGDPRWRDVKLNDTKKDGGEPFHKSGCAVTACAIALSRLGGKDLTPRELDRRLDQTGGYAPHTNAVVWQNAADAIGAKATVLSEIDRNRIKRELAAGRSVVVRVKHVPDKGGLHFLTLVAAKGDQFEAIDPNGGKVINFDQHSLRNQSPGYAISGEMILFSKKVES